MYVDALPRISEQVGYGAIGMGGSLGYEGKPVSVQQRAWSHALSMHPPARVRFALRGQFRTFEALVALNDDVPAGMSHADFVVLADDREVASAVYVVAGERPRRITADVAGAGVLELVVKTSRWEWSHAVWVDPRIEQQASREAAGPLVDCLGRAELTAPAPSISTERCIATVVSPGFEGLLDDMLGSLAANGECQGATLVVVAVNANRACMTVARKYGAAIIRARALAPVTAASKAVLYSIARVVEAQYFVCLDADMLVLGSLSPLFAALGALPEGTILAVREANRPAAYHNLGHALTSVYGGTERDLKVLGADGPDADYALVVNDGLFAGGRAALLALDGHIRSMGHAAQWVDACSRIAYRNQFVFNLAAARLGSLVELDGRYNVQLNAEQAEVRENGALLEAEWRGVRPRVLHFNGLGRRKLARLRNVFSRIGDPLVDGGGGDGYAEFLRALRRWVGRHGMSALSWSFYGTADALAARIADPSTLPLFATLHYLIRSNGCERVLETGTARGVSAACLASAVAHRPRARVVTFDHVELPGRKELWAELPARMQACIEARTGDAIEGLRAALAAGERYEAALLDSTHTEEQVWAEFQLATSLVCPGGVILVHDANLPSGTVGAALERVEAAGFNVVRLWTAQAGEPEDDGLGLAIIDNRRRSAAAPKPHPPDAR